jgi:ribosomal protein S27AE
MPVTKPDLDRAFRGVCPHCGRDIFLMSPVAPNRAVMASPPDRGDGVRCDGCGEHSLVASHEDRKVYFVQVKRPEVSS